MSFYVTLPHGAAPLSQRLCPRRGQPVLRGTFAPEFLEIKKNVRNPYHFIRFWQGVLPNFLFDFIFGKIFGVYSVMDHFTGKKVKNQAAAKAA